MLEIKEIAAAAARYSSENMELRATLQEIEKKMESILRSDYPFDELQQLYWYVKNTNEQK